MAENNGNGNGNGNKGNGENKGNALDLTGLNENLSKLPVQIQEAVKEAVVAGITAVRDQSDAAKQQAAADAQDDDTDIEVMSNKELSEYILKNVTKAVSEIVKPLNSRITGVQSSTEEDRIRAEAIAIAREDPMFMEMTDEMGVIAKSHPDLSVRDIYSLAKINNPDKVEKLTSAQKEKDDKDKEEKGEHSAAFGGLLPNSGVKSSADGGGKMDPKDAANKAFDEVMKDVPAHILSGENA